MYARKPRVADVRAVGHHFAEVRDELLERKRLVGHLERDGLPDFLLALATADPQIGKLREVLRPEPDDRVGELASRAPGSRRDQGRAAEQRAGRRPRGRAEWSRTSSSLAPGSLAPERRPVVAKPPAGVGRPELGPHAGRREDAAREVTCGRSDAA